MYFWDIKKLNKDLYNWLNEKENLKYLLAYSMLSSIILFIPNNITILQIVDSTLQVIFTIILLVTFYNINGWNNGKNFLSRYFAIWFVSLIRSLVFLMLPLITVLAITLGIMYWENIPTEPTIFDSIFTILYYIWFIYLNIKYLKDLKELT